MRHLIVPCLLLLPALVSAGEPLKGIEITPFLGYMAGGDFQAGATSVSAGSSAKLQDDSSYGLTVNWPAEEDTEWEIYLGRQSTALGSSGSSTANLFANGSDTLDVEVTYLQGGGTYHFDTDYGRTYIVATLGASRFVPEDGDLDAETFLAGTLGGGIKLAPTRRLGLRLEGRVFGSLVNSDESVFCQSGAGGAAV